MNDTERVIKSLQTMRDETAVRAARAQREAETAQRTLKSLDTALNALLDDSATGLRVPAAKTGQIGDADIRDIAVYVLHDKALDFGLADVVTHNEFLSSLVNPVTRSRNLRNLWDENLTALIRQSDVKSGTTYYLHEHDVALHIAENRSKETDLALTTLNVAHKGPDNTTAIHILRNTRQDKMLVVGEKISSKLREAFRKANIHYVDRKAADAKEQIKSALADVLGPKPAYAIKDRLLDAFKYRNSPDDEKDAEGVDFVSALVNPKFETIYPKYIVRPK